MSQVNLANITSVTDSAAVNAAGQTKKHSVQEGEEEEEAKETPTQADKQREWQGRCTRIRKEKRDGRMMKRDE